MKSLAAKVKPTLCGVVNLARSARALTLTDYKLLTCEQARVHSNNQESTSGLFAVVSSPKTKYH